MRRDYYPFGEAVTSSGDEESLYQFTGKEKDSNTGLFYFGARYYDPGIGRFISVDPLAEEYPGLTPYHYVANNPLKYVNPDGRKIILGSKWDRLNNFFGRKTDPMIRLEGIAKTLNSTSVGANIYNSLNARPEKIFIRLDNQIIGPNGKEDVGLTTITKVNSNKASEISIQINADEANAEQKNRILIGDQGAATTMGHELGHADAALTDLRQYIKEATKKNEKTPFGDLGTGNAEVQGLPIENAVRIELLQKNEENKYENEN